MVEDFRRRRGGDAPQEQVGVCELADVKGTKIVPPCGQSVRWKTPGHRQATAQLQQVRRCGAGSTIGNGEHCELVVGRNAYIVNRGTHLSTVEGCITTRA